MINWFEIPVADFSRARKFYSDLIGYELKEESFGPVKVAFFNGEDKSNSGSINYFPDFYTPGPQGIIIYLNASDDLSEMLSRVEPAGGKILMPKKLITTEVGFMTLFSDTDGNRLALISKN